MPSVPKVIIEKPNEFRIVLKPGMYQSQDTVVIERPSGKDSIGVERWVLLNWSYSSRDARDPDGITPEDVLLYLIRTKGLDKMVPDA